MMDQYKEQYKKETEQIHAPADLIARTKAAVREEEARIRRERAVKPAAQVGKPSVQEAPMMSQRRSRGAMNCKWAYPLSAAAAVIVLVSVSLMMRGLGKSSSESPTYEMAAAEADSGGEESATAGAAEAFDEAFPAESAMETEGAAADKETGAAEVTEFAGERETASAVAEVEDMATEMEAASADAAGTADPVEETKRAAGGLSAGEGETENAMSQKQESAEMLADAATPAPEITVEKVWKKPAFVNRKDIEARTYENMVFQIVEEENGWTAYVESENGGGYVIRGETESVEAFLEEGYKRLEEMSW